MSQRHQSGANVRPAITEASPAAGTLPDESAVPLSVDPSDGGVRVHVTNGGSGGTASTFGAAIPSIGTAAGFQNPGGNMAAGHVDGSGNLLVNVAAGSGSNPAAGTTGAAVPSSADFAGINVAGNLQGAVGFDLDSGAGTEYVQGISIRKVASGGSVEGGTLSNPLRTDPTGTTPQPISAASLPLPTGAATLAKQPALGTAGTASADVITIQGIASMTKLLVTPDSVALPANQSVNVAQLAGTTTDTNSGVKSAGTLRVVLATDQPALTNKLLVTPDSVALPANQSVNVSQMNGVTPLMGSGIMGTGSPRVTIASDNDALTVKQATGTNLHTVIDSGTLSTITNVVHIDDNSGSLTVDNGGTFAVQATIAAGATSIAKAEDVLSADADVGVPAMAVRKATPANTSGTDGDYEFLQMSAGRLWTSSTIDAALPAGSNVIGHVIADSGSTTAVTQATGTNLHMVVDSGTVTTVSTVTSLTQMNGAAISMGTGVRGAGVQRVTIATDDVVPASQSGTWTVQPGNTANTTPWLVSQVPTTSGGCSISRTLSANNTTGINAKGSAGQVYGWVITNVNASARFVKIYNKATAPTVGSDTPVITLVIPGNATGSGMVAAEFTSGLAFSLGIGYGITGLVADNDTTAPAANEVIVNLFYK